MPDPGTARVALELAVWLVVADVALASALLAAYAARILRRWRRYDE